MRLSTKPIALAFLGAGRSTRNPAALDIGALLSGTVGSVLDPVFSLRQRISVEPGASTALAFTTAAPEDRRQALAMAALFGNLETGDDVFKETAASNTAQRAELGLTPGDAALFQRLAAPILFSARFCVRASPSVGTVSANQHFGRTASRATCQLRSCESESTATWTLCAMSCGATHIGTEGA